MSKADIIIEKYAGLSSMVDSVKKGLKSIAPTLANASNKATFAGANLMNHHNKAHGLAELGTIASTGLSHAMHDFHAATPGIAPGQVLGAPLMAGGAMLGRAAQRLSKL